MKLISIHSSFFLLVIILIFFYIHYVTKINGYFNPLIVISILACNRLLYLNKTVNSLFHHIYIYEKNLKYNVLFFDQGTVERYLIVNKYNIDNSFFLNPSGMDLSFNILFSCIYSKYVFLVEEDWVVDNNVEGG